MLLVLRRVRGVRVSMCSAWEQTLYCSFYQAWILSAPLQGLLPPLFNYLQQQEMLDVFGNSLDNLVFRPYFISNILRSSYSNDWYFFLHPDLFPLFCTED